MLSAISALGEMEFMLHEGTVDSKVFVRFLEHLMVGRKNPVILIVDGHPVHHSKLVREHVESTGGKLELEYLPPYSPQLNPDELVWKCVKAEVAKQVPKTAGELMEIGRQALRSLAKRTQTIIGFFRHPDCQYALQN